MKNLRIKQRLVTILGFLIVSAVIGGVVMVSGVIPVTASSGHWKITKSILHFARKRSVATHSTGTDVPPLDDDALVLKGAGHFETGCVQCHGSPAQPRSPIALGMTATPPSLPARVAGYEPEELFYIVKHGIKMTGMPAWPARQRDDEVWAMVAFLLELPEMDEQRYQELIRDPDANGTLKEDLPLSASLLESCQRCHGDDGLGRGTGVFPTLAGQNREYLLQSLRAYADGTRHSGMMEPIAAVLDDDQLQKLADYYTNLPSGLGVSSNETQKEDEETPQNSKEQADPIDRGRTIAHEGIPGHKVPACVDCHGPGRLFVADSYPLLSGQYADYMVLQLKLFQANHRGGTDQLDLMRPVVEGMTEQDFRDVAAYYASLSSEE